MKQEQDIQQRVPERRADVSGFVTITIYVRPEMKRDLRILAAHRGATVTSIVERAIASELGGGS